MKNAKNEMIWANLVHLGYNFWVEEDAPPFEGSTEYIHASSTLLCNKTSWNEITEKMVEDGLNTILIDLGEGVRYESHPEIAVKGSWSVDELKKELSRLRGMGLNPIPKLNFSASHDEWLGVYSRNLSSPTYYQVCKDLINEVIDIFDNPDFFHLGMDEETYINQERYNHALLRQHEAWWKDFYFLVDTVERRNVRSWIWSDYLWDNQEQFLKKMPKSVLQSNWYYRYSFNPNSNDEYTRMRVKAYLTLDEHGYDQIPTGSNWACAQNFGSTVQFCKDHIAPERLKGFLQTSWAPTIPERKYFNLAAVDFVGHAKRKYYSHQ
ncbi:hypothetical protein [Paenibacillus agaridevorans]|uniref:hypothetical protein n=1 Tax=Paenibacillus agaridevorans TaxID=171404 RepID=UPI001BE45B13|nr:hypothetical protein [Paenibacillus agaridevorans]